MPVAVQIVRSPEKAATLLQAGRLQLLEALEQPDSAASLARKLGMPRQKINYHLHELERGGFLELVEERRKGNCMERVVRATARTFVIAPHMAGKIRESSEAFRDRFSVSYLIAAAARIIRELAGMAARARNAGKRLATLTLESEIRFGSAESRNAFAEELAASVAVLTAKYHDENAEHGRGFRLLAAVYPAPAGKPEVSEESVNME